MTQSRSFSRRLLLGSSAAVIASGAAFTAPVHAAPKDDDVTAPAAITAIRGKKGKGKKVPNAATVRDFNRNPHLRPVGPPLNAAEQAQYKRPITASGPGL